jgi:CCR4-NOT transcriptional regulation complex NOT5 subunit
MQNIRNILKNIAKARGIQPSKTIPIKLRLTIDTTLDITLPNNMLEAGVQITMIDIIRDLDNRLKDTPIQEAEFEIREIQDYNINLNLLNNLTPPCI